MGGCCCKKTPPKTPVSKNETGIPSTKQSASPSPSPLNEKEKKENKTGNTCCKKPPKKEEEPLSVIIESLDSERGIEVPHSPPPLNEKEKKTGNCCCKKPPPKTPVSKKETKLPITKQTVEHTSLFPESSYSKGGTEVPSTYQTVGPTPLLDENNEKVSNEEKKESKMGWGQAIKNKLCCCCCRRKESPKTSVSVTKAEPRPKVRHKKRPEKPPSSIKSKTLTKEASIQEKYESIEEEIYEKGKPCELTNKYYDEMMRVKYRPGLYRPDDMSDKWRRVKLIRNDLKFTKEFLMNHGVELNQFQDIRELKRTMIDNKWYNTAEHITSLEKLKKVNSTIKLKGVKQSLNVEVNISDSFLLNDGRWVRAIIIEHENKDTTLKAFKLYEGAWQGYVALHSIDSQSIHTTEDDYVVNDDPEWIQLMKNLKLYK